MSPSDKLTILFLAANPRTTDQLKLDEEVRAIDQSLRLAEHRDRFDLRSHWALRYSDLAGLLLRYNPHIVHFSGHGSADGQIVLSDDSGQSHLVEPATLAGLFQVLRDNIRCVVLNACYTEKQARGIARSVDCVVGMKRAVVDDGAVQFAAAFYLALGYGRSVATAFELGRNAMGAYAAGEEKTPKLLDPRQQAAAIIFAGAAFSASATPGSAAERPQSGPPPGPPADAVLVAPPLRELKGRQLLAAMNALLAAYSSESDLAQMVKTGLDENLAAIAGGNNLKDQVFNLLEWARMRGRLTELLQAALDGSPHNPVLKEFVAGLSTP